MQVAESKVKVEKHQINCSECESVLEITFEDIFYTHGNHNDIYCWINSCGACKKKFYFDFNILPESWQWKIIKERECKVYRAYLMNLIEDRKSDR